MPFISTAFSKEKRDEYQPVDYQGTDASGRRASQNPSNTAIVVAIRVGYSNYPYFSTVFKNITAAPHPNMQKKTGCLTNKKSGSPKLSMYFFKLLFLPRPMQRISGYIDSRNQSHAYRCFHGICEVHCVHSDNFQESGLHHTKVLRTADDGRPEGIFATSVSSMFLIRCSHTVLAFHYGIQVPEQRIIKVIISPAFWKSRLCLVNFMDNIGRRHGNDLGKGIRISKTIPQRHILPWKFRR